MLFDNIATITQELVRLDGVAAIKDMIGGHKVKEAPAARRRKSFAQKPVFSGSERDKSFSARPPPPSANKVAPSS